MPRSRQMMSFCLRPSEKHNFITEVDFKDATNLNFTFADLKEQHITSSTLLLWSASINLAERYQIFLNNYSNLSSENKVLFYNCTSPWFGPFCRFAFDSDIDIQRYDIVFFLFGSRQSHRDDPRVTCYKHLHCQTKLLCLDWREICDGKSDCLDGSDENNCWQLEVNECANNEYRCHNGQCIPIEFVHDGSSDPDCIDRSDEGRESYSFSECSESLAFRCEEHTCRPGKEEFPCGDGRCTNGIDVCHNGRNNRLPSEFCSNASACFMKLYSDVDAEWCEEFCSTANCLNVNCSIPFEVRFIPLLFGHVRFLYSNKEFQPDRFSSPDYVCYEEKLCVDFPSPNMFFNNLTCRHLNDLGLTNADLSDDLETFVENVIERFRQCLPAVNLTNYCNYPTMYQCENSSKCISKQRLLDGIRDCPFDDDETYDQSCSLTDISQRFICSVDGNKKCFASLVIQNGKEDCRSGEDEKSQEKQSIQNHIYFQTICDGKRELSPVLIDGQNETDETHCQQWPCDNTYSKCDQFWLCTNGADEVNCPSSTCPEFHHECVLPNDTSKVSCLPLIKAGDGVDDCLGATDERVKRFRVFSTETTVRYYFHCWNDEKYIDVNELCNRIEDCPLNDDEAFCKKFGYKDVPYCAHRIVFSTDVDKFLCSFGEYIRLQVKVFFKLHNIPTYPPQLAATNVSDTPSILIKTRSIPNNPTNEVSFSDKWWCNRGLPIGFRMGDNTSTLICLCPPSYYGDKCQYQNQRVSLTLQMRARSGWRNKLMFLITLIDSERNIESYDHIEYLPFLDCALKFHVYLLYSTRPKNSSKNYSVQIDAFNRLTMNYRASWVFPLRFPFLPVHRLSVLLKVPFSDMVPVQRCWPPCTHGQCFYYVNDQNSTFCRCEPDWSGSQCDIAYTCDCAPGSLCISDSICLCPPSRFGPRCHLFQLSCYSNSCMNGGQCVTEDTIYSFRYMTESRCICPQGYVGERCGHRVEQTQIDISFHHQISVPPSLLIHFIAVQKYGEHNRTTIMKKVGFDQYSLSFVTSVSFNLALIQMFSDYYLIILRQQTITLAHISTQVIPFHRCRSIGELFNETFAKQHLLKRIKYYHFPCSQQLELICFYDDVHFCLCTLDRTANCFEFDHNITYDCGGDNFCENEGYCFQDNPKCPTSSFCACRQCYFGSKCQFSTKGSTLSLDTILGYHIHNGNGIRQQPDIVKAAIAFTIIVFVFGSINSFFTFRTFQGQETHHVGCGFYLFASSIISLNIVIIFTLKFWFLLTSQIGSINNRSFLYIQCVFIDFLLRCLLSISDWLSACVAIERAVNVSKGVKFDKAKSKRTAKWITLVVILCTSCTYIYDLLHRGLIDDEEEQRTWCFTQYSPSVQVFDWLLNIFHFSLPFAINSISAVIVIVTTTRTRPNSQKQNPFKKHLCLQLQYHKHLLISPLILVVLALPRLIISFLSGCMKSARDSWLYLIGYFISFVPPMMTFVIFVLPSEMYKKAFGKSMKRIWQR